MCMHVCTYVGAFILFKWDPLSWFSELLRFSLVGPSVLG